MNERHNPEPLQRRPRARKLRKPLGPFATGSSTFDAGKDREIEVMLDPHATLYRLKGQSAVYSLPHGVGYQKALALKVGANIEPRSGKLKRGEQNL